MYMFTLFIIIALYTFVVGGQWGPGALQCYEETRGRGLHVAACPVSPSAHTPLLPSCCSFLCVWGGTLTSLASSLTALDPECGHPHLLSLLLWALPWDPSPAPLTAVANRHTPMDWRMHVPRLRGRPVAQRWAQPVGSQAPMSVQALR